jgi:hypothetical protein
MSLLNTNTIASHWGWQRKDQPFGKWLSQQKIIQDSISATQLGASVSISNMGFTAVVGAPLSNTGLGAAKAFQYPDLDWSTNYNLLPFSGFTGAFGSSICISSDSNTALVGQPTNQVNKGAVSVFSRVITIGGVLQFETQLTPSDVMALDAFGSSVSISSDGNIAAISSPNNRVGINTNQGAVYVFTRSGSIWTQQAKLVASDGSTNERFGDSVSISSDGFTILVSTANVVASRRSGYVFTRSGSIWTQQAKLITLSPVSSTTIPTTVSLSSDGNTAIFASPQEAVLTNTNQGAVYVFTRSGSIWTQQAKLVASDGNTGDLFGCSVSVSADGNKLLIGAYGADILSKINQGAAYYFIRTDSIWSQQIKITSTIGFANDTFGRSVSLSPDGHTAMIGAPSSNIGKAYIFAVGAE